MHQSSFRSITALCVLPFVLAACSETSPSDPRTGAPLVRTIVPQTASSAPRSFTGTIAARVQSDLGFRVSGKVLERLVDTGQSVRRGQVLMRIDPVDLKLAELAHQEAVVAAQAQADQTTEDESRYRDLLGTGAIAASDYDQIKAAAEAARARLSAARAQAEVAVNATRYAELVADADGIVMDTMAEPGQVVTAGQTVVRLAHAGPREASVQLPETLRPALGSTGMARRFGSGDTALPGILRQLSDTADPHTRTFDARYVLEGELASAPLGTTVTITIPHEETVGATGLQVPIGALFDAGKGPGVWVVSGEPPTVAWQPVTVQSLGDDSLHITGELQQGVRLVALGAHLLREGQQVRVEDDAAAVSGDVHE